MQKHAGNRQRYEKFKRKWGAAWIFKAMEIEWVFLNLPNEKVFFHVKSLPIFP